MRLTVTCGESDRLVGFRSFWCRYVHGFDDRHHCQRCLLGTCDRRVGPAMETRRPVRLELPKTSDVVYLCGLASAGGWANNFHLAVVPQDGATVIATTYLGDEVRVEGARHLEIPGTVPERYADRDRSFITCRNFLFGAGYYATR